MTDNSRRWCIKYGKYESPRPDAPTRADWAPLAIVLFRVDGCLYCQHCKPKTTIIEIVRDEQQSSLFEERKEPR